MNVDATDSRTVAVRVTDSDGDWHIATAALEIENIAPTADAGPAYTGPEGTSVVLSAAASSHPDFAMLDYAWDFNYDGTAFQADATGSEITSAELGADGPLSRTVAVRVTDSDGDQHIATTTVTVTNVPPTLTPDIGPGITEIIESQTLILMGMVSDPALPDTITLTIDWGDGTQPHVMFLLGGGVCYTASHSYLDDKGSGDPYNDFLVTVTATDDDGEAASISADLRVHNAAPEVEVTPLEPVAVDETFTLSGSFTDLGIHPPDTHYLPETHTLEIDWGDGSANTALSTGDLIYDTNGASFSATHAYNDIGDNAVKYFRVKVTVRDDDMGLGMAKDVLGTEGVPIAVYQDPDLDADSNNDDGIDPDNSPLGTDAPVEADSAVFGHIMPANHDDDNLTGFPDSWEQAGSGENDLAEVRLKALVSGIPDLSHDWDLTLLAIAGGELIRIWDSPTKDHELGTLLTIDLNAASADTSVWIEGLFGGRVTLEAVLTLNGTVQRSDIVNLMVVEVTNYEVERRSWDEPWELVADSDVLWQDNDHLWAASVEPPEAAALITDIHWLYKAWADRFDSASPWSQFNAAELGEPPLGNWAVTPELQFGSLFVAKMAQPSQESVTRIKDVRWEPLTDDHGNIAYQDGKSNLDGLRFFPERNSPKDAVDGSGNPINDDEEIHDRLHVVVELEPPPPDGKTPTVHLRVFDPDHPLPGAPVDQTAPFSNGADPNDFNANEKKANDNIEGGSGVKANNPGRAIASKYEVIVCGWVAGVQSGAND